MDVSLAQVFSSPLGRLQLFEVAAFARELLTGIEYMHINLKITHGALSSNSVLLSVTGAVKIANLGTAMIENNDATKDERDVEAVGMIIIECLEPKMLKHDFLQLFPGPSCLKSYIRFARETAAKEVEVVTN
ncbi:Tyrosine-protein kinase, active site [Penicillium digitatum]|uniref:Tyrosine-protein kinase, active site n=1 Tax=Penicillium digitatum TaxID=36651 RepID=A0A7T6XW43_PENDI|nr:Tyrosine-protein kinase, active site [Penicillium digitatum]